MQEQIIVSMTSYGKRLYNLPTVIDSILKQSVQPDLIVLNLAVEESVPCEIRSYLIEHKIEVNRVPDTKVYKKLIPTLKKYPKACVISIDDDFLYPPEMIGEFMMIHERHPLFPISGNKVVYFGMQCHCGCASLTCADYFGDYLNRIDEDMIKECPSDDMLYTFLSSKTGHPYLCTQNDYFVNMESYGEDVEKGYSKMTCGDQGIIRTYEYLLSRFGPVGNVVSSYINDSLIASVINNIHKNSLWEQEDRIRSSRTFRIGKALLKPFAMLNKLIKHDFPNHMLS